MSSSSVVQLLGNGSSSVSGKYLNGGAENKDIDIVRLGLLGVDTRDTELAELSGLAFDFKAAVATPI